MAKKKVLFITPEIYPYFPEGYISNICRYLPQGIQERENEIRTFMPKFGCVNEHRHMLHEVIRLSGQNIIIEDTDHPLIIKVASLQNVRMQIYFIDSEDYFKRKTPYYDAEGNFYPDNDSRAIFYAKGVMETVRKLGWEPDIIHCHGWISALVPMFIKTVYKDDPLLQGPPFQKPRLRPDRADRRGFLRRRCPHHRHQEAPHHLCGTVRQTGPPTS